MHITHSFSGRMGVKKLGTGKSGRYFGTYGSNAVPGSIDYMRSGEQFSQWIRKRSDVDVDGFYDIIAHGTAKTIEIEHNGRTVELDHRSFARLLSYRQEIVGKNIRLLSCSTGSIPHGFAQGLAQRLGIDVKAPSSLLWVNLNGSYFVADGKRNANNKLIPVRNRPGTFITFSPRRRKK